MPKRPRKTGERVEISVEEIIRDDEAFAELVQQADDVMAGGRLIRSARLAAELSQAELSRRMGVSQPRVSDMESGLGTEGVSYATVLRAVRACGFEPSFRFHRRADEYNAAPGSWNESGRYFAVLPARPGGDAPPMDAGAFAAALREVGETFAVLSEDLGEHVRIVEIVEHENGYEEDVELSADEAIGLSTGP
jgi:transcriptional regulator with XRE-family HTH domain